MKTFYSKYQDNFIYSQNGEEGIVAECFKRIGVTSPVMCEFGAHNGKFCSNTRYFVDIWAGSCLMIEANRDLYNQMEFDTRCFNIVPVLDIVDNRNINKYLSVLPYNFDLVSMDTDGDNDYDTFEAMYNRPKVIIIEIDSSIHPGTMDVKTGYNSMVRLAIKKGYFLLCHTGNLVFVDNSYRSLFPEIEGDGVNNYELYFNKSWLKS